MFQYLKDLFNTNKKGIGLFLTGAYLSFTTNGDFLTFLSQHPYINMVFSAVSMGLIMAGWLKSDKEQKILQILRKSSEPDSALEYKPGEDNA